MVPTQMTPTQMVPTQMVPTPVAPYNPYASYASTLSNIYPASDMMAKQCNVDLSVIGSNFKQISDNLKNVTDKNKLFDFILSDNFYIPINNIVQRINNLSTDNVICMSGGVQNACDSTTKTIDSLLQSDLDNIEKIIDKYSDDIQTVYNWIVNISSETAQKCGKDPNKVKQLSRIFEKLTEIPGKKKGIAKYGFHITIGTIVILVSIIIILIVMLYRK